MGWTFEYALGSRLREFLQRRAAGWDHTEESGRRHQAVCLAHKYAMHNPGSGSLWKVMETTIYRPDGSVESRERWIALDMVRWGGGRELGWGYKDVEASMGVYDLSCPLKYLEMVPEPKPCSCVPAPEPTWPDRMKPGCSSCYERRWRRQVLEKHEAQSRSRRLVKELRPGDVVVLKPGWSVAGRSELTVAAVYGTKLVADGARIPLRAIDVEKTSSRRAA